MLTSGFSCSFFNERDYQCQRTVRITSAWILVLVFVAMSARMLYGQAADPPAPRTWSNPLGRIVHPDSPLLGDFIPCMFDEQDEALFRGVLLNVNDATRSVVKTVIQGIPTSQQEKTQLNNWVENFTITGKSRLQWSTEVSQAVQSAMIATNNPDKKLAERQAQDTANEIVGAVEAETQSFSRPDDVSCSMAILPWNQTKDDFGRHVAGEFVAIQVTVRNLNKDNEFLLHDVQIAIDTQPGMLNRFQASMNQPLVRGVGQTGQLWEPRNFAIRLAEFIGTVAASSSIPASKDFSNGVSVFQGAFVPGLKTLFPDETVNQLARLDDASFAASSNKRIVVPTRGSVSFVTFIPSKPLESINFECLYKVQTGTATECTGKSSAGTTAGAHSSNFVRDRKKYKSWSPLDLLAFQNSAYVIVAGVHVKEQNANGAATVTAIDCPKAGDGTLDLGSASSQTVECKLAGDGLESVSKIVLKSATDSTDTSSAEGVVTVSGDPTKATVTFKRADLEGLKSPLYSVFLPDKNGLLQPTSLTVKVKPKGPTG